MHPSTTGPISLGVEPYQAAPDTWIISELFPAEDLHVPVNSAVIAGAEPVIVDTGTARNRDRWMEAVWSIVDPSDVRWVFLSHDDHDHVGNLLEVLDLCPDATLVTTWFSMERLVGDFDLPLHRCRWINEGESFTVGDRDLVALRPPFFDAPTTRGLFDPKTGFYWAVDSFGSLVPAPVTDVADLPVELWEETFLFSNRLISPWHTLVDPARYDAHLARLERLGITAIGSAHGTVTTGANIARGFELLRQTVHMDEAPLPGQPDLDAIVAAALAGVPA